MEISRFIVHLRGGDTFLFTVITCIFWWLSIDWRVVVTGRCKTKSCVENELSVLLDKVDELSPDNRVLEETDVNDAVLQIKFGRQRTFFWKGTALGTFQCGNYCSARLILDMHLLSIARIPSRIFCHLHCWLRVPVKREWHWYYGSTLIRWGVPKID